MTKATCPWCNNITCDIDNHFRFKCCGKVFHECPNHNKGTVINGKKYIIGGPGPNECRYCKAYLESNIGKNIPPPKPIKKESDNNEENKDDDKKIPKHMIELCSKRPNLKRLIISRHGK